MIWPFSRSKKTPPPAVPSGFPPGYAADARRPDVFDPALKHHFNAFIKGAPSGDEARALAVARSKLLTSALHGLARSPARDLVVVRGSLTLEAWFPDRARRAHDIDLVARDAAWDPSCAGAEALLREIRRAVRDAMVAEDVRVLEDGIALDSIWTYERAEGRRLSVPWTFAGSMRDVIQVDVVFRELLQDMPALEVLRDGASSRGYRDAPGGPSMWFASRAESLAWKILWLDTDSYPQAKDLYDAMLLAEHVPLPLDLLRRVYAAKSTPWQHGTDMQFMRNWNIDWAGFDREYPELVTDDQPAWVDRLASSIRIHA